MKITIIGAGNLGGAMARGLVRSGFSQAADITCTAHTQRTLDRLKEYDADFRLLLNNAEAARDADIVVLAVKPWLVEQVIQEMKPVFDYSKQIIVSVAAGITTGQLYQYLLKNDKYIAPTIFRAIPNTAVDVVSSMTFLCSNGASAEQIQLIEGVFNAIGSTMSIDERLMNAGTALASCGIAYALRYIRASIEGGVEMGFYPDQAQEIVLRTVQGAVNLLLANGSNPEQEIDKVTTPGGITIKGLNEMELAGFTSAVIRGLKKGV